VSGSNTCQPQATFGDPSPRAEPASPGANAGRGSGLGDGVDEIFDGPVRQGTRHVGDRHHPDQVVTIDHGQPAYLVRPMVRRISSTSWSAPMVTGLLSASSSAVTSSRSSLRSSNRSRAYPDDGTGLALHLVMDNYAVHKHPAVKAWLAANPRVHVHFIGPRPPTRSSTKPTVRRPQTQGTSQEF
jgi:hypothetical protein